MMLNTKQFYLALLMLVACSPRVSNAITLDEYGITITETGLIDSATGLRWLDSQLTDGGLDELQDWLDAGWRIATYSEFLYLVTRQEEGFVGFHTALLEEADYGQIADSLSFELNEFFSGPWLCAGGDDPDGLCSSTGSFGGQFEMDLLLDDQDELIIYLTRYISFVPMYGSIDCGFIPCSYEGRSLLVRPVPLPPAVLLMIGALFTVAVRGRRSASPGGV